MTWTAGEGRRKGDRAGQPSGKAFGGRRQWARRGIRIGDTSALAEAGLPSEPGLVVETQLTREHGFAAARESLSRPDRPTAVFTANDMQALGVYQAARESNLRIPHDLSVVRTGCGRRR